MFLTADCCILGRSPCSGTLLSHHPLPAFYCSILYCAAPDVRCLQHATVSALLSDELSTSKRVEFRPQATDHCSISGLNPLPPILTGRHRCTLADKNALLSPRCTKGPFVSPPYVPSPPEVLRNTPEPFRYSSSLPICYIVCRLLALGWVLYTQNPKPFSRIESSESQERDSLRSPHTCNYE